ncbi:alpha/beta hydrolase [Paenibacillus lemnae]|uniref:Alpha/beta hydrolase n=1 Tax=Paenibacillus lemnae TaxID=1330551 RepID=A0A848MD88_PAELE|nr:alpha/beta hydrolase [Paenibacillus lemnae]NMO98043.1 alpha/beta hydrolase [Paenibacillus lemnae]
MKVEAYLSSHSTCEESCHTTICFIAGVVTYRNNFEAAAREMSKQFPKVKILTIFPYGTANGTNRSSFLRLLGSQLTQAGYDINLSQSKRVRVVSELIRKHSPTGNRLILIGHSAGGVIAYRSGLLLEEKYKLSPAQIFAVGSPKFPLKDIPFNQRFTYITGQSLDRITRIGRWGIPGSRVYRGKPGREIQMNFNPANQGWRFHASYFLDSGWQDADQDFHANARDLVSKIAEICR